MILLNKEHLLVHHLQHQVSTCIALAAGAGQVELEESKEPALKDNASQRRLLHQQKPPAVMCPNQCQLLYYQRIGAWSVNQEL